MQSQIVTGESRTLSFDEAIANAVGKLTVPHPDALFKLRVREITGESGGIAGFRILRVEIEATC